MPRKALTQKPSTSKTPKEVQRSKSLTQPTLEQSFSQLQTVDVDKLVNNCVRYVLYRAGKKLPVRKADLQKNVLRGLGRRFDAIIQQVSKVLEEVYGYELYLADGDANKTYLVANSLPYVEVTVDSDLSETDEGLQTNSRDVDKIFILIVLAHVFMANNSTSENALFSFLKLLHIDSDERHEFFGKVKERLATMVKQKYLATEIEELNRKVFYSWGARANHEISKHEVLNFVCKMFRDRNPRSWANQYQSANAQQQRQEANDMTAEDTQTVEGSDSD